MSIGNIKSVTFKAKIFLMKKRVGSAFPFEIRTNLFERNKSFHFFFNKAKSIDSERAEPVISKYKLIVIV